MKLTAVQRNILLELAASPRSYSEIYKPSAKLVELGLATRTEHGASNPTFALTEKGRRLAVEVKSVGRRVELHPATDRWMMGDRFGEIVAFVDGNVRIKLDVSGKTLLFKPEDLNSNPYAAPASCCAEPQVRGGRCVNCGTWINDK
jgi:hypothetical protein